MTPPERTVEGAEVQLTAASAPQASAATPPSDSGGKSPLRALPRRRAGRQPGSPCERPLRAADRFFQRWPMVLGLSDSNLGIDADPFDKRLDRGEGVHVQAQEPVDGMEDRMGGLRGEPTQASFEGLRSRSHSAPGGRHVPTRPTVRLARNADSAGASRAPELEHGWVPRGAPTGVRRGLGCRHNSECAPCARGRSRWGRSTIGAPCRPVTPDG